MWRKIGEKVTFDETKNSAKFSINVDWYDTFPNIPHDKLKPFDIDWIL